MTQSFERTSRRRAAFESLETRQFLSATPNGLAPADVRAAYGVDQVSFVSSIGKTIKGDGSGQTIAIINPYVASTIKFDLNVFNDTFSVNGKQTLGQQYGW